MAGRVAPGGFRDWNEAMAGKYDQDIYYTEAPLPIRLIEQCRIREILRMLQPGNSDTILEVGCGTGNVLKQVVRGTRIGLDISFRLVRVAREKCSTGTSFVSADAETLPFRAGSVDKVLCTEVLEHVLRPEAVLQEILRVLRPGGIAIVSVPNEVLINRLKRWFLGSRIMRRLVWRRSRYRIAEDMTEEWHLHAFDRRMLEGVIPNGFRLEEVREIPCQLVPVRYVVRLTR